MSHPWPMVASIAQNPGAVWKSRWTSWAPVPVKPTVSVDVKQHFNNNIHSAHKAGWPKTNHLYLQTTFGKRSPPLNGFDSPADETKVHSFSCVLAVTVAYIFKDYTRDGDSKQKKHQPEASEWKMRNKTLLWRRRWWWWWWWWWWCPVMATPVCYQSVPCV